MQKSVALCTYNGEKYIRPQLDSILQQSAAVQEIVVCDDQSSDQTFEILKEYQSKYPQIFRIYQNEQNLGYVRNFEKAIMLCSGDLIFLSDQDDLWFENKVETVEKAFISQKNIQVLCHNITLWDDDLQEKDYWETRNFSVDQSNAEVLERLLIRGNIFPGMSMVISESAKQQFFPLKKMNDIIIHDFELMIQACKNKTFFALNSILGHYRLHDDQNIGFNDEKTDKEITAEDLYVKQRNIAYIRKIIKLFQLDSQLLRKYIVAYRKTIEEYLNQFPLWKRLWLKAKLTYYYKIK